MNIALLGSTGSIGTQCLSVVDANRDKFNIYAIAAYNNIAVFQQQLDKYMPRYAAMYDAEAARKLRVPKGCTLYTGPEGICELARLEQADTVLVAIVGIAGLDATYAAAKAGKRIAIANKEALVTGGGLITQAANESGAVLLPVDSEHSAVFQCLNGENRSRISRLILTASGGAFRDYSKEMLKAARPEDALRHPNWAMGRKITIDCATMMNKGLEVIEAHWLFGVPAERIEVVVHRQSIVHSMVEFADSAVLAQLGCPDMRLPIMYALSYPERTDISLERMDFTKTMTLSFSPPDTERFPCLTLAYEALKAGGGMPAVLNAANEIAVEAFLDKRIAFTDIAECVRFAMDNAEDIGADSVERIHCIDKHTREKVRRDFLGDRG